MFTEEDFIVLSLALGTKNAALKPLLAAFPDAALLFGSSPQAVLEALPTRGRGGFASLLFDSAVRHSAKNISLWCHQNGVRVITIADPQYPRGVAALLDPPAVLYCRGTLRFPDIRIAVGVVGTRHLDEYGENTAYKLSFELASAGVTVISGMAAGVDGVAAAGAIEAGGNTVAVLGCGIDVTYPRQHGKLASEIAERGVVVTEFPPGTSPQAGNFPIRNRIISALSDAVLVVQANEKSGSLITARYALSQGKPLFAVPGNIDEERSAGTNMLLRNGAIPALSASDILSRFPYLIPRKNPMPLSPEAMQYTGVTPEKLHAFGMRSVTESEKNRDCARAVLTKPDRTDTPVSESAPDPEQLALLDERQRTLYGLLPPEPFSVDYFTEKGVPVKEATALLTVLELCGLVRSKPGGLFEKTN